MTSRNQHSLSLPRAKSVRIKGAPQSGQIIQVLFKDESNSTHWWSADVLAIRRPSKFDDEDFIAVGKLRYHARGDHVAEIWEVGYLRDKTLRCTDPGNEQDGNQDRDDENTSQWRPFNGSSTLRSTPATVQNISDSGNRLSTLTNRTEGAHTTGGRKASRKRNVIEASEETQAQVALRTDPIPRGTTVAAAGAALESRFNLLESRLETFERRASIQAQDQSLRETRVDAKEGIADVLQRRLTSPITRASSHAYETVLQFGVTKWRGSCPLFRFKLFATAVHDKLHLARTTDGSPCVYFIPCHADMTGDQHYESAEIRFATLTGMMRCLGYTNKQHMLQFLQAPATENKGNCRILGGYRGIGEKVVFFPGQSCETNMFEATGSLPAPHAESQAC